MKIAYFVNQYPKVSHTFIRREIFALEKRGFTIARYALRGWDAELVDPVDVIERERTRFVLQPGLSFLARALLRLAASSPLAFLRGIWLALQTARGSHRSVPHHLVSLAEAAVIARWARDDGIEHMHAHFGTNSAEVVMLARAIGGPSYSFTVHGPDEWDMPQQLKVREKVRDAEFVVCISSYTRAQAYRWARTEDWSKIHVVHCGLDPSFHAAQPVPVQDNRRIVCIGRLSKQKAQELLVEAVARLDSRGIAVDLVLAGDGETRGELEELIAKHGLGQRVRITGWISGEQVRAELLAARALVLPSFAEGLPVVIMEALALARPVLTTYIGGIPELVRHGHEGWLFPSGSVDELVSALADCFDTPVARLQAMGQSGRERVLAHHCVETEAAKLADLLRHVGQRGEAA